MPKESDYTLAISGDVSLRLRYRISGNDVEAFTVQLEYFVDGNWIPVVRYDSAHGIPHRDVLNPAGDVIAKEWLPGSFNEVLTSSIRELRVNWKQHISRFIGRQY